MFARAGHVHPVAGDALNRLGVELQTFDLLLQLLILFLEPADFLLERIVLSFLMTKGEITVLPINLVNNERDADEQEGQDYTTISSGFP